MIVIYGQDGTYLFNSLEEGKETIISLYGAKFGPKACAKLVKGRPGTVYRRYGGPRIEIVSDADAERIRAKETAAGMLL